MPWDGAEMTQPVALTPAQLLGPLNDVERKHAPARLYVAGDRAVLEAPRVAIVGTRKPSEAGCHNATGLSRYCAEQGITVVSGLAKGIDTAAHEAALRHGGRTIAVLGTPLDRCFPASNRILQERIMREHLAISQFAPGSPVARYNFPMRNRTMALIAHATIIVEAGEKSGALSQGWESLRLGRPLLINRTLVEDRSITWPGKMLDYSAVELTTPSDILERIPSPGITLNVDVF